MSDQFDISLIKGEPFTSTVTASLCASGQFNLSGYYIQGGIKYRYLESNLTDFQVIINSDSSGVFTIGLTSGQTSQLPATECIYYVKAFPSGSGIGVVDLLNGYAEIYPL